jgi:hypothetical protein
MSGKGDKQRPTDKEAFDRNFDTIFGRQCKHDFVWGGKRMPCYQCRHCGAIEKGEQDEPNPTNRTN